MTRTAKDKPSHDQGSAEEALIPVPEFDPSSGLLEEEHAPTPEGQAIPEPAGPPPLPVAAVPSELEILKDRHLRLQADFDNFRKRTHRERGELQQVAIHNLILELLPVLDHLELGIRHAGEHDKATQALVEGMNLTSEQLRVALKKFGLHAFPAEGEIFDPHRHEAIARHPSPDVPDGRIAVQIRTGYMLGETLLRPAQVIVSSGPAPTGKEDQTKE